MNHNNSVERNNKLNNNSFTQSLLNNYLEKSNNTKITRMEPKVLNEHSQQQSDLKDKYNVNATSYDAAECNNIRSNNHTNHTFDTFRNNKLFKKEEDDLDIINNPNLLNNIPSNTQSEKIEKSTIIIKTSIPE